MARLFHSFSASDPQKGLNFRGNLPAEPHLSLPNGEDLPENAHLCHLSVESTNAASRKVGHLSSQSNLVKTQGKRRALMSRSGLIRSWDASLHLHAESQRGVRGRASMLVLELRGEFPDPVKKVSDFILTVFGKSELAPEVAAIPSIGSIISMRGSMQAVVELEDREFQLVMAMATTGKLTAVHLSFQEPRYGSGLIESCSFSSRTLDE